MTASGQEHQPIIEKFPVYERVPMDWQPVDGDVYDTITKAFLEVQWPGNSIERHHDTGGSGRYGGAQGQRVKRPHGVRNADAEAALRCAGVEPARLCQSSTQHIQRG